VWAVPEVSAIVLAGGRSRRLGTSKAFAPVGGIALIDRAICQLRQVSDDLLIATNEPESYHGFDVGIVADAWPGMGALGGIHSGLLAARHERAVVVGCDMPFLNPRLLRSMIILSESYDVVIPRLDGLLEPLHAIYSRACAQPIEGLLRAGGQRIVGFFDQVRVRYVERSELEVHDPDLLSIFNVNTPDDLRRAEELASRRHCAR
jgi:molybdopterin-guanine dinucleotide biosynthesis protein A